MRKRKGKTNKPLIGYLLVTCCVDRLIFWDGMRHNDPTVVCKKQEHHFVSRLDDLGGGDDVCFHTIDSTFVSGS